MEGTSVAALLGRLAISLAVVLALLAVAARVARRRGLGGTRGTTPASRIEVLARQGLGRTSSVQLVRVAGRTLVLGVTEQSVQVLGEADPLLLAAEQALVPEVREARATPGWGPFVQALQSRTVRRS